MVDNLNATTILESKRIKCAKRFIWAGFLLYVLMMGSKNVYTAELVTIMGVFEKTKAEASLAMTYYFLTYAVCQVILSFIMGKINLRLYLVVTGSVSAIITILLGLAPSMQVLYFLCAINGIFQAGIYSGCMASFSKYAPSCLLAYTNKIMALGTAIWGLLSYGIPPLFVGYGLWNIPFIILGVLFFISAIYFLIVYNQIRKFPPVINDKKEENLTEKPFLELKTKSNTVFYFVSMMIIILLANTVYYSIVNWIPSMLHDVFDMPEAYSILITLMVPILSAIGSIGAINICQRKNGNIFFISNILGVVSILSLLPLVFFLNKNIILTIACMSLYLGLSAGSRGVLTGYLGLKMRVRVNVGSYLAAANAMASISAAVAPPVAGKIIDSFIGFTGYSVSYLISFAIGMLPIVLLSILAIKVNKQRQN